MTDPRLICEGCGEFGELIASPAGFCVRGLRASACTPISGKPLMQVCCMTAARPTEQQAIQAWVALWDPDGLQ